MATMARSNETASPRKLPPALKRGRAAWRTHCVRSLCSQAKACVGKMRILQQGIQALERDIQRIRTACAIRGGPLGRNYRHEPPVRGIQRNSRLALRLRKLEGDERQTYRMNYSGLRRWLDANRGANAPPLGRRGIPPIQLPALTLPCHQMSLRLMSASAPPAAR